MAGFCSYHHTPHHRTFLLLPCSAYSCLITALNCTVSSTTYTAYTAKHCLAYNSLVYPYKALLSDDFKLEVHDFFACTQLYVMQDHVLTMFTWEFFSNGIKMTIIHVLRKKSLSGWALDVLWCQPIKLIQVVSTSEFHEYW